MDFRNAQQPGQPAAPVSGAPVGPSAKGPKRYSDIGMSKWLRTGTVALLFCLTVLVVAVIGIISFSKSGSQQGKYVNTADYQAVFLTNGQVYFGHVDKDNLSQDYIRLQNIYYLTQNTSTDSKGNTTTDGNYTLVKLGCQQIHDPLDEMIIERSQVSFWENLNSNGKVVTSIKQFQKTNPKGPDCTQVSNQTQASSSSNTGTQGNGTSTGTGTSTTGN